MDVIKAVAKGTNGRTILLLGLSFGNLNKFRAEPRETYIKIDGTEMGLPIDVTIFSAESEPALARFMEQFISPDTKVEFK